MDGFNLYPSDSVVMRLLANRHVDPEHVPTDVRSRLYYEAHITIEPQVGATFADRLGDAAGEKGWRMSTFAMFKPGQPQPDAFISYRDKSLRSIVEAVQDMVRTLERRGFTVLRWKIEDTLFDSKRGDAL